MSSVEKLVEIVFKYLATRPSRMVTIPTAALTALLWFLVYLGTVSWHDGVVGTILFILIGGALELGVYRTQALPILLYKRARPLSTWQPYAASFVFYLFCGAVDLALMSWFYCPTLRDRPEILITDVYDVEGREISSQLRDELVRKLSGDSCRLQANVTYVPTPLRFSVKQGWLKFTAKRATSGVFVYGEPFQGGDQVCSGWVPDKKSLELDSPIGGPIDIYPERPSGPGRTAFDGPYCSRITRDSDGKGWEDAVDEIMWKIHILAALDANKRGDSRTGAFVASHGAQEGRGEKRYRAIVSSMIEGLVLYDEGHKLVSKHPCDAKRLLGESIGSLAEAVKFNTEVEKEEADQAPKEPGRRFLYNYLNMYQTKLALVQAMTEWHQLQNACDSMLHP